MNSNITIAVLVSQMKIKIDEDLSSMGMRSKGAIMKEYYKLDRLVEKITSAVNTKNPQLQKELFPYFEKITCYKPIAHIFECISGIPVGETNNDGIKAFIECFGADNIKQEYRSDPNFKYFIKTHRMPP